MFTHGVLTFVRAALWTAALSVTAHPLRSAEPSAKLVHSLAAAKSPIVSLRFLDGDSVLFACARNGTATWWDVRTGKNLRTAALGVQAPSFTISPSGKYLQAGTTVLAVGPADLRKHFALTGIHDQGVWSAAFSRDERELAVGGCAGEWSACGTWGVGPGSPSRTRESRAAGGRSRCSCPRTGAPCTPWPTTTHSGRGT